MRVNPNLELVQLVCERPRSMAKTNLSPPDREQEINKSLKEFFQYCAQQNLTKHQIEQVCWPLRKILLKSLLVKLFKWFAIISVICTLVYEVPVLNWNATAVGRLVLIQILPLFDWRYLHNLDCLIPRPVSKNQDDDVDNRFRTELRLTDCDVCENFAIIDQVAATTYATLSERYLKRRLPVIIVDAYQPLGIVNYIDYIFTLKDFRKYEPCDLQTNLVFSRTDSSFEKLLDTIASRFANDSFFLHFRNCQSETIKLSRLLMQRPYFYSPHLEPAYSSWLLMSQKYRPLRQSKLLAKTLILDGLICVTHFGDVVGEFYLRPREPCNQICDEQFVVRLSPGHTLLFSTDLWIFSYLPSQSEDGRQSLTVITETQYAAG